MTKQEFWAALRELFKNFAIALVDLFEDREESRQKEHSIVRVKRAIRFRRRKAKIQRVIMRIVTFPRRWYKKQRREAFEYEKVSRGKLARALLWVREKAVIVAAWALWFEAPFVVIDRIMYPVVKPGADLPREVITQRNNLFLTLTVVSVALILLYITVFLPISTIRDNEVLKNYRKGTVVFAGFTVGLVTLMFVFGGGTPTYSSFQQFFGRTSMVIFWVAIGAYALITMGFFSRQLIAVWKEALIEAEIQAANEEVEETEPEEETGEMPETSNETSLTGNKAIA